MKILKIIKEAVANAIAEEKKFIEIAAVLKPITSGSKRMMRLVKLNASVYEDGFREHFIMLVRNQTIMGEEFYYSLLEAHREVNKMLKVEKK